MKRNEHKPGINEAFLLRRRLKLVGFSRAEAEALLADLDRLPGVDRAELHDEKPILKVAYDATKTCLDHIQAVLKDHHCDVSHDWWSRFKESWYRGTEQNVRDNAAHEPLSCHKVPR